MEPFMKRLQLVQSELKAPKNRVNKFGGYKYRNVDDILSAVKPLMKKHGLVLVLSDDIELDYVIYFDSILFISEDEAFVQLHYFFSFSWVCFYCPYYHLLISYQLFALHLCYLVFSQFVFTF